MPALRRFVAPSLRRFSESRRARHTLRAAIRIFNQAAHPDRRQRFQSAEEFLRSMKHPKWTGKRRAAVACLAAIGAVMVALSLFVTQRATLTGCKLAEDERSAVVWDDRGNRWSTGRFSSLLRKPELIDLDGDGFREFVVATGDPDEKGSGDYGRVYTYRAHRWWPELRSFWSEPLSLWTSPPWKTKTKPEHCGAEVDYHGNLDGIPGEELIVVSLFPGSSTRIVVVNGAGKQAKLLGEFWHYGNVGVREVFDLDGDGNPELFCVGWCNDAREADPEPAYWGAFLLELGSKGELRGQWRLGDGNTVQSVGSLLAYGYVPRARLHSDTPKRLEAEKWYIAQAVSVQTGQSMLSLDLKNGLRLPLDSRFRLIPDQLSRNTAWDPANPIPPSHELWQPLWPPK